MSKTLILNNAIIGIAKGRKATNIVINFKK